MKRVAGLVILALFGVGCDARSPAPPAVPSLKDALAGVDGAYTVAATGYDYSARGELERILANNEPREIVPVLVDCMDDQAPSRSTLEGQPVSVGMVCYEALTQLVYYEPTAPNGDVALKWDGYVSPRASAQELRAAKQAWTLVVKEDAHIVESVD
jgi:hypothetical protein